MDSTKLNHDGARMISAPCGVLHGCCQHGRNDERLGELNMASVNGMQSLSRRVVVALELPVRSPRQMRASKAVYMWMCSARCAAPAWTRRDTESCTLCELCAALLYCTCQPATPREGVEYRGRSISPSVTTPRGICAVFIVGAQGWPGGVAGLVLGPCSLVCGSYPSTT